VAQNHGANPKISEEEVATLMEKSL
jgi:hypothetical protein